MAEPGATADDDDYDVKDEELVDFEGSDYGFESGGEEEVVETTTATVAQPPFPVDDDAETAKAQEDVTSPKVVKVVVGDPLKLHKHPKPDLEDGELDDAAMPEGSDPEAVANGGDDDEDENDRRDRKRRKDRYAAERQFDNKERRRDSDDTHSRRDSDETHSRRDSDETHSRQYQRRGSDKMHSSQRNNYSRGSKSVAPFQRGNSGPGIMGPGRPSVSMEYGGHLSLRSIGRGYPRPVAGMVAHGRLNQNEIQNHNLAVQSHLLRQHQMAQEQVQAHVQAQAQAQAQVQARVQAHAQVEAHAYAHAHAQAQQAHAHAHAHAHAQAQVHMANAGALRASISGSTMRPVMGIELVGGQVQGSHGLMHMQVQKPDSGPPQMNYPRALEVIGTRAELAAGRGSVGGLHLNQPSNRDRAAAGRQLTAWAPSSGINHEISNMPAAQRRGQGQGRGQVMSPLWGDPPVGGIPTGYPVLGHTVPASPGGVVPLRTPKRQGSLPIMMPNHTSTTRENANMKNVDIRPQVDGTWRTNGSSNNRGIVRHHSETLAPYSRKNSVVWSKSSAGGQSGNKRSRENGTERRHSSKSVPSSNGMGTAGNNLIQLGGPVTKSRVLSVSGFPESTSMAVVVEAFEKQGKILDFKKDEKGNSFHITFSNVSEAVSAKRSLHRTLLNGGQITVDYTVQRY